MAQKDSYKLTKSDIAQILENIMEQAQEAGVAITVQNVLPRDTRPAGLLVFFGGFTYDPESGLGSIEEVGLVKNQ
jgi:hypothetical protein